MTSPILSSNENMFNYVFAYLFARQQIPHFFQYIPTYMIQDIQMYTIKEQLLIEYKPKYIMGLDPSYMSNITVIKGIIIAQTEDMIIIDYKPRYSNGNNTKETYYINKYHK